MIYVPTEILCEKCKPDEDFVIFFDLEIHDDDKFLSTFADRPNGLTQKKLLKANTFLELSDNIHYLLDGQTWVGHNIHNHDIPKLLEAFRDIKKDPPSTLL